MQQPALPEANKQGSTLSRGMTPLCPIAAILGTLSGNIGVYFSCALIFQIGLEPEQVHPSAA